MGGRGVVGVQDLLAVAAEFAAGRFLDHQLVADGDAGSAYGGIVAVSCHAGGAVVDYDVASARLNADHFALRRYADFIVALRQFLPERISDQRIDHGLGLLFIGPVVQFSDFCLYFFQQISGYLFDFLDIFFREVIPEQHVIKGELFVAGKPFPNIALLLLVHAVGQIHQVHKRLLYGGAILFAVVIRDDLLVSLIIIDAVRIGKDQLVKFLLNDLLQILEYKVLFLDPGKFSSQ